MTVREVELPDRIRQASELSRLDYTDSFLLESADLDPRTTPEGLLRETLEGASDSRRKSLHNGWQLLGLRHGPLETAGYILGWPIKEISDDLVVVAAGSRIGLPAELMICRCDDGWIFATLQTHRNPAVGLLWRAVEPTHKRIVQRLLVGASERLRTRRDH